MNLAQAIVSGKIRNYRTLCMRLDKSNSDPSAASAAHDLKPLLSRLATATNLDTIRGIEGQATKTYFRVLRRHLRPGWDFPKRQRRPPPDPVNPLLSFAYTLLHQSIFSALEIVGPDPYCGFYHQLKYGRPALALDLMEEFRPIIADSVVLTVINKRILEPDDFEPANGGSGLLLSRNGIKKLVHQYERRLQTRILHPRFRQHSTYQRIFEVQARLLAKAIQDSDSSYQPFLAK